MRAAAARVVFGAAGSRLTQPVTAALTATRSIAAAVSGTRIANGLPGSANGAERGAAPEPNEMSAATETTVSRTSSKTVSLSASSESSTTNRPKDPSTWALAIPGIRRTGSSTAAAYSCQRGNGSNGSRSRCTRRPLCQRTGGVMVSEEDPLGELLIPSARPVDWAADCTTGPANSTTGLANTCTAPAAPAAVEKPARTTWVVPPVTAATTLPTPGILIPSPFNCVYRANDPGVSGTCPQMGRWPVTRCHQRLGNPDSLSYPGAIASSPGRLPGLRHNQTCRASAPREIRLSPTPGAQRVAARNNRVVVVRPNNSVLSQRFWETASVYAR